MRLTLCEAPTREIRPDYNTGRELRTLQFAITVCRGYLKSPEDAGDGAYNIR